MTVYINTLMYLCVCVCVVMSQQVKALPAKPDDLSLIPRISMVEEENQLQKVVL